MKRLAFGFLLSFAAMQAHAAEPRYSTWSDPNKPQIEADQGVDKLVRELRSLVDEAERARAADPKFLRDLKALADRYQGAGASGLLFKDDFSDGDYTQNPVWTVTSGKYWIEKGYGLRSFVEAGTQPAAASNNDQTQKISKEELIIGVLGAVLGAKTNNSSQQVEKETATQGQAAAPAEIHTVQKINNAFSIEMDLSSWVAGGHLEFGPYQGNNRNTGYRLVYRAGQTPALQLVRHYTSSSAVVASYQTLKLEDQKSHKLIWNRTINGQISVSIDGQTLMQVNDQSFRDDFSGFVMKNIQGDFIVKSLSASGI